MARMSMNVRGFREAIANIKKISKDVEKAAKAAVFEEATNILAESQKQVPVDTGALRASGFVAFPEVAGGVISVSIGYGGPAGRRAAVGGSNSVEVGYAWIVHENLTSFHPVGNAKYLELPHMYARAGMADRIAARIAEKLGK